MLNGISWLYARIIDSRNSLYGKGVLEAHEMPAPTISVGNITVGGTGKTPLVAFIAGYLAEKGETVCVISRGYRRRNESDRVLVSDLNEVYSDAEHAGDEPFEMARKLLGRAIVISDRDRVSAAGWAFDKFGVTVFLLDDAFQHRRAARDLDLVVIDSTNPFGNSRTIPKGILREPLSNLSRADAAVLTRTNQSADLKGLRRRIKEHAPDIQIFASCNKVLQIRELENFRSGVSKKEEIGLRPAIAFCGLGNPQNFFGQLVEEDVNLADSLIFPDHHKYRQSDIEAIENAAAGKAAEVILTTAKDAVKLEKLSFEIPCFVYESEMLFENQKGFAELIDKAIKK